MTIIPRNLTRFILNYINSNDEQNNTLLLSGARQVGKTTLIEDILKNKNVLFLNLFERTTLPRLMDDAESFEEFEKILLRETNFKPSQGQTIVFDEAQESKRLGRWIRFFKEKWKFQKAIVTGSILSNMFEDDVAYPVGRVTEITLRPFSFGEYLLAINRGGLREVLEKASFENPLSQTDREALIRPYLSYLTVGGMPEIVIKTHRGAEDVYALWDKMLRQYALDIERHMEEIFKTLFVAALDRIADITCHPLKNSQIISTDSPSYRKLPRLLEVLERWHLVHKVSAKTKQPESGFGLASKKYLFDVGLTNFFINHSRGVEWKDRSISGNLVYPKLQENFVCNEILAHFSAPLNVLNYYKETRNSREIDFLFPIDDIIVPIEVKSQGSFSKNSLIPMLNFLTGERLRFGVLVYNGEMTSFKFGDKTIFCVPPYFVSELPRALDQATKEL